MNEKLSRKKVRWLKSCLYLYDLNDPIDLYRHFLPHQIDNHSLI